MGFLEVMATPEKIISSLFDGYSSTFSSHAEELLESLIAKGCFSKEDDDDDDEGDDNENTDDNTDDEDEEG